MSQNWFYYDPCNPCFNFNSNPCCNPCCNPCIKKNSCPPVNPNPPVELSCTLYGDGSAGNQTILASVSWVTSSPTNGNFMFRNLTINSGVTLTVASGTKIRVLETFINNGTIIVVAPTPGENSQTAGQGGFKLVQAHSQVIPINQFGGQSYQVGVLRNLLNPGILGGGNGGLGEVIATPSPMGGDGGGALSIYSKKQLTNNGIIIANGTNAINNSASSGPGGGAGGIIILVSRIGISNSGTINANGGNGATSAGTGSGGGGGGGVIHLLTPTTNNTGTITVNGGLPGTTTGNPTAIGGGGGAMGGDGGNGEIDALNPPLSGSTGQILTTTISHPECMFY